MKMPFSIPGRRSSGVSAESFASPRDASSPSTIDPRFQPVAPNDTAAGFSIAEKLLARAKEWARFDQKGLPDAVKVKLQAIGQQATNARGVTDKARRDIDELRENLSTTNLNISIEERQLARLRTDTIPPALVKYREEKSIIEAEIARLQRLASEYTVISTETGDLFSVLSKYVMRQKETARPHTMAVEPRVLDGEGHGDSVERLRRRVRELKADLDQVRFAPYPSDEAKRVARTQIDQLAARGAPTLFDVIDRRGDIKWPELTTHTLSTPMGTPGEQQFIVTTTPDALAVLAWLHRDALVAALDREIDTSSQDDQALTDEQRIRKSAQISSDILATEREEEALIDRMEASGALFLRRTDADPRAVLGFASDMPAPDVKRI